MDAKNKNAGCLSFLIVTAIVAAILYFFVPHYDCIKVKIDGSVHCSCEYSTNDEWNKFKDNLNGQHNDGWEAVTFRSGYNPCDTFKKIQANLKKAFPEAPDYSDSVGTAMDTSNMVKLQTVHTTPVSQQVQNIEDLPNTPIWKDGTKIFCDDSQLWKIAVARRKDSLFISTFPGANNKSYTNYDVPVIVDTGLIKGGDIYTHNQNGFSNTKFRYVKGTILQANTEGGFNHYPECQ